MTMRHRLSRAPSHDLVLLDQPGERLYNMLQLALMVLYTDRGGRSRST